MHATNHVKYAHIQIVYHFREWLLFWVCTPSSSVEWEKIKLQSKWRRKKKRRTINSVVMTMFAENKILIYELQVDTSLRLLR